MLCDCSVTSDEVSVALREVEGEGDRRARGERERMREGEGRQREEGRGRDRRKNGEYPGRMWREIGTHSDCGSLDAEASDAVKTHIPAQIDCK